MIFTAFKFKNNASTAYSAFTAWIAETAVTAYTVYSTYTIYTASTAFTAFTAYTLHTQWHICLHILLQVQSAKVIWLCGIMSFMHKKWDRWNGVDGNTLRLFRLIEQGWC